jgi:hypothetical protein
VPFPHSLRLPAVIVSCVFAAACGENTITQPASFDGGDLAQVIAAMDVPYFTVGSFATLGAQQSKLVPSSCSYSAAVTGFVCPTTLLKNLRITRSFFLSGASGPQAHFDPATTDVIRTAAHLTNADTAWGWVTVTTATEDFRLTGLRTNARVLDGGSVEHMTAIGGSDATRPDTVAFTTTRMVRQLTFSRTSPYPASGLIEIDILTEGGLGAGSVHQQIVFDGSNRARWITTSHGPTRTCIVDLSAQTETICQ